MINENSTSPVKILVNSDSTHGSWKDYTPEKQSSMTTPTRDSMLVGGNKRNDEHKLSSSFSNNTQQTQTIQVPQRGGSRQSSSYYLPTFFRFFNS